MGCCYESQKISLVLAVRALKFLLLSAASRTIADLWHQALPVNKKTRETIWL